VKDKNWPAPVELEQWLMRTLKDADTSVGFLRRMLQMNPAYGAYLTEDEDLAGIVQLFAKRFRAKILASENPIQVTTLYEPLCELAWRVVGHVFHAIIDLTETENIPLPKEPIGQVKMLLQTNMELSKKFNDMRRAYLRELSEHRDKQRTLSKQAEFVINSLQEQPVMFFEPLEFVLDNTTKDFIREVVEERVKLGLRTEIVEKDVDTHDTGAAEDVERQLKNALAENRQLRATAARELDARRRHEDEANRNRAAMEAAEKKANELLAQLETIKKESEQAKEELNKARRALQAKPEVVEEVKQEVEVKKVEEVKPEIQQVIVKDDTANKKLHEMSGTLAETQSQLDQQVALVAELREELKALEKEKEKVEKKLKQMMDKIAQLEEDTSVVPEIVASGDADEELKRQLEKHLKIEKELRAANRALEQALAEKNNKPKKEKVVVEEVEEKKKKKKGLTEADLQEAIDELTEKFEKKEAQLKAKIESLKQELADMQEALDAAKAKKPKEKAPVVDHSEEEKAAKWKQKYHELQDQHDELQHEFDKAQQQIRMLLAKVKQLGGAEAVQELMHEIKLTAPPPKKQRKKKAYERLYEDAQRRIVEMRMRQEKLKKLEEDALRKLASRVKDKSTLHQAESLSHLHKAAVATRNRFHDALSRFEEDTADAREESPEQEESPDEGKPKRGREMQRSHVTQSHPSHGDRSTSPWNANVAQLTKENERLQEIIASLERETLRLRTQLYGGDSPLLALQSRALQPVNATAMGQTAMSMSQSATTLGTTGRTGLASTTGSVMNRPRSLSPHDMPNDEQQALSSYPTFGVLQRSPYSDQNLAQRRARSPPGAANRRLLGQGVPAESMPSGRVPGWSPDSTGTGSARGNSPYRGEQQREAPPVIQQRPLKGSRGSAQLLGNIPLLSGEVLPWKRAGAEGSAYPAPPGWNPAGPVPPSPARGPEVLGRVPTTSTLEPISKGVGSGSEHVQQGAESPENQRSTEGMSEEGSRQSRQGKAPPPKSTGPAPPGLPATAPMPAEGPEPKAQFCVTALRSQQSLSAQSAS